MIRDLKFPKFISRIVTFQKSFCNLQFHKKFHYRWFSGNLIKLSVWIFCHTSANQLSIVNIDSLVSQNSSWGITLLFFCYLLQMSCCSLINVHSYTTCCNNYLLLEANITRYFLQMKFNFTAVIIPVLVGLNFTAALIPVLVSLDHMKRKIIQNWLLFPKVC